MRVILGKSMNLKCKQGNGEDKGEEEKDEEGNAEAGYFNG